MTWTTHGYFNAWAFDCQGKIPRSAEGARKRGILGVAASRPALKRGWSHLYYKHSRPNVNIKNEKNRETFASLSVKGRESCR